jgi:hypothetical protein
VGALSSRSQSSYQDGGFEMTGAFARDKGQRGEREIVARFVAVMERVQKEGGFDASFSEEVKRNTLQSDRGGYDVANVPMLAIEVKRAETLQLNGWWNQTVNQAKRNEMPVLFYRQNRRPWHCMTYTAINDNQGNFLKYVVATFSADDFFEAYAIMFARYLETHGARVTA